jgi:hypothetical protein
VDPTGLTVKCGYPEALRAPPARLPIGTLDHAASELLRLGADVEVLARPVLWERIAEAADGVAAMYCGSLPHVFAVPEMPAGRARLSGS